MALDGLYLRCLKTELDGLLPGARVDKIYLPTDDGSTAHCDCSSPPGPTVPASA